MIGALIGLPVTLVKFPVLLLTSPVRVARIASEKAKRSGILPVPIGGTSYKAHQILFAVKQAAQNEEDDTAAELWLSALHAAQAAADDILESLRAVDSELRYWKRVMAREGTGWFMAVQQGPARFLEHVKTTFLRRGTDGPHKHTSARDEIERRVVFLRSLRSALATALSEVHGAGDTLLLRDVAVAGLSGGDGDGMVSPGMGLRGGDEGAAEDVGGELLGAVARAAEMGARRVGIAMREARKEVEGLLKERSGARAGGEASGRGEPSAQEERAEEMEREIAREITRQASIQVVRRASMLNPSAPGRTSRPSLSSTPSVRDRASAADVTLSQVRQAVVDAQIAVGVTFKAVPGRSAGEGIRAMKQCLERRRKRPIADVPAWCKRPSRFQQHWLRYSVVGVVSLVAAHWIYRNSRLSGSDRLEKMLAKAAQDVKTLLKEHVQEPIENLIQEATAQLASRRGMVDKAEVDIDRISLSRMLEEFERDNTRSGRAGGEAMGVMPGVMLSDELDIKRMAMLMDVYERELKNPLVGFARGSLVRSLLIQIQKLKVDVGTSMLELDSVMRSQELTLALMAAFPAFIVVGSLVGGAYSLLSPTPPDFKRLALRARMEAIALERALQEAVQVEALGWDTMAAESRGMLILQTARLHTALFRLYSTAGIRSARQREEWGAIREDVRRLQDHYADLSLKLATLQRMTRCYKAFAV